MVETPFLLSPGRSKVVFEPLGVTLIMGSWNLALWTTLLPLVPVIAAGNTAVIKPSELSTNSSKVIK